MKRKIIVSSGRTMPKKGRDKIAASFTAAIIFLVFLALAPSLGHAMAPANADVLSSSSTGRVEKIYGRAYPLTRPLNLEFTVRYIYLSHTDFCYFCEKVLFFYCCIPVLHGEYTLLSPYFQELCVHANNGNALGQQVQRYSTI